MTILKSKYDSITDVPENFRELFEEKDGKALLKRDAIEGVKTQGDIDRVQDTLKKERKAREEAEKKAKAFERIGDRDPEELLALADENAELKAKLEAGGDKKSDDAVQKLIDAAVARAKGPLERDLAKFKGEAETFRKQADELSGTIKRSKLESELTRAATAIKVRGEAIDDVLRYQDLFEVTEDGQVVTKSDVKGVSAGLDPQGWLAEMQQSKPHWWPDSSGGGARGGNGAGAVNGHNPFAKGAANLTKASQLMRSDPGKAEAYAKAAGYASTSAAIAAMATAAANPPAPGK